MEARERETTAGPGLIPLPCFIEDTTPPAAAVGNALAMLPALILLTPIAVAVGVWRRLFT